MEVGKFTSGSTDQALSHPLLYSWWAMVSYGVLLVTLGAFIFGQTTANAIFVDRSVPC